MPAKRIPAVILIFLVAAGAWFTLGTTVVNRTREGYSNLNQRVQGLCGQSIAQLAPTALAGSDYLELNSSTIEADLQLDYRRKGLLWFPVYNIDFNGAYSVVNNAAKARAVTIRLPLPTDRANLDTFEFTVNGASEWVSGNNWAAITATLAPGEKAAIAIHYKTRGLRDWTYSFDEHTQRVQNFSLLAHTNVENIDFPDDTVAPSSRSGNDFRWEYVNRLAGFHIGISMPDKLNPGDVASRISFFAPLGLFFFLVVLLVACIVGKVNLHPVHLIFLAAGFFAFHLLFTYLVDHVSIFTAFLLSSAMSLGLVINYMRLVVNTKFALIPAALAQFVYLILFSYAFTFQGYTGLIITIGAILTLGVLMQATAKVNWEQSLAGGKSGKEATATTRPGTDPSIAQGSGQEQAEQANSNAE